MYGKHGARMHTPFPFINTVGQEDKTYKKASPIQILVIVGTTAVRPWVSALQKNMLACVCMQPPGGTRPWDETKTHGSTGYPSLSILPSCWIERRLAVTSHRPLL